MNAAGMKQTRRSGEQSFRLQASRCSISYRASPHRHTMTRGGGGGGQWRHVTRSCVDREPTDALNVTNHQEAALLSAPGAKKKETRLLCYRGNGGGVRESGWKRRREEGR